jgi:hypothetical protein
MGTSVNLLKPETKGKIRPSPTTSKEGLKKLNIHQKQLGLNEKNEGKHIILTKNR